MAKLYNKKRQGIILKKIISKEELSGLVELLKFNKQKIIFSNGCFDILHPGHVDYLSKAKKLGDCLIVAVNSDESVRKLKGESRPINNLGYRMNMLAGLESVDFVIMFEEETPYNIINAIVPDVLVKGSDYKVSDIVGSDIVLEHGGEVKTIDFLDGYSTSAIIDKIKNS